MRVRSGEGKVANKLMKILTDLGHKPYLLVPATGWYRFDVYRWEVWIINGSLKLNLGCWQTMTDFVKLASKFGVTINDDEIWANEE